jgi:hypothetical protein
MAEIAPQVQNRILSAVNDARRRVRELLDSSRPKNGYMGFDLADSVLAELHEAIAKSRNGDQITVWLKKAVAHLKLTGGGEVWPAVEQTEQTFKGLWEQLEANASKTAGNKPS